MGVGQEPDVILSTKTGFQLRWTFFWGGSLKFGQNKRLNFGENIFFYGDHLNLDKICVSILVKTFFFGDHLNWDRKSDSIGVNTNQNLGQDRLRLFPASKTAPPMQIPGYVPGQNMK